MRLLLWVTAAAVLSLTCAKNSTSNPKPKRQLDSIRTPQNLQYSLVLPHSRVSHFRSLSSGRRISNVGPTPRGGKLPPYAVQMEPVVQYSQKDPLYDPTLENLDDSINKNDIQAQPKILNVHGSGFLDGPSGEFGPPYGALPTAPLYSHDSHPHYYDVPEPIIEIIIKESNETLPAPPPTPILKKKKEPVQVFYVKYSKDPHSKDKVVYDKPIPAITPPSNDEDYHHEEYVTVTPEPYYAPQQTTTLRAIIKPESEVYHSDSSVKVTFGSNQHHHGHYSDRREGLANSEDREETAPRPAIAYPQAQPTQHSPLAERPRPQFQETSNRHLTNHQSPPTYRPVPQQAQSRIQFQPPYLSNEQQVPRQVSNSPPFRNQHIPRQNTFVSSSPSHNPNFGFPGPIGGTHFSNSPTAVPGPLGPIFTTAPSRPQNGAQYHQRLDGPPSFIPRPHNNGQPTRPTFHSGPQRPFHTAPQSQQYFDDPKYLQENYHTITTEQVEPPKDQILPNRQNNFNFIPRPSPNSLAGPSPSPFPELHNRPQHIPTNQQLPQQRPVQQFSDNKPPFAVTPSRSPFYNLKPSPPHIEQNAAHSFQQHQSSQQSQHFSFHQGANQQLLSRPSQPIPDNRHQFQPSPSPLPQPTAQSQFLPHPSSSPHFNFHSQSSASPERPINFHHHNGPSDRPPQFNQAHNPSERPPQQQNSFAGNPQQHNLGQFVPNGGELVAAIPKYEQHITVNGLTSQSDYSGLSQVTAQPTPTASVPEQQYRQNSNKQYYDSEQEQVRLQLAQNVQKQQEEINRLQSQLLYAQQQQQQQQQVQYGQQQQYEQTYKHLQNNINNQPQYSSSPKPQYVQERARPQPTIYPSSTASPPYYQSTSRTVEIKPTTQKYVSSTINSINTTPEARKQEKKKRPTIELPDEVPDDLRQQLLSSGILDNADISVLDYDKVGDTPLDSLPPDQLANFFSAGGGQQIASSELRPIIVRPNGDKIESRIDNDEDDQEISASENIPNYITPPSKKEDVEMKVVHFDPDTLEGQNIAKEYVKDDATKLDPVALNDKKYNRYLPLKVSGNQFPLPDILKGRKVTSVVVLAPVETEVLNNEHSRSIRETTTNLKGIKFVAGDSLQDVLKRPTKENFEKWLDTEKKTATDQQSVVLLVTAKDEPASDREIYMYDIGSGKVNKLSGELSNAFVEAAENNSLSKDIEQLAIEGEGTPENFSKRTEEDEEIAEGSDSVPLFVNLSDVSLEQDNRVSISSGYSKTKLGRSLRRL